MFAEKWIGKCFSFMFKRHAYSQVSSRFLFFSWLIKFSSTLKGSIYIKDVLKCICVIHLIEMIIWNSSKDLIPVRHTIKTIKEMS